MRIMMLNQAPKKTKGDAPHYQSARIEELLNGYASPGTKIELHFPDDFEGAQVFKTIGAQNMLNGLHHIMEAPAIIKKIVWAADNGYDAVIQSNTFDPGVEGGRLAVGIPVVGLFQTALHVGATIADKIGIIVPLDAHLPYTWRKIRAYGMGNFVTGIQAIGIYGEKVQEQKEEIFDKTVGLIRNLVDDTGAECVLPLGGALIPYVVDPADLAAASGVQVLNTKSIGIRFTEMCVDLGLTQSPITYPKAKISYEDFTRKAEQAS